MVRRGRRGFTLIELLVVIVIVMLLMALLLPAIVKALCVARQGVADHLIDQLGQASKAYEIDQNAYPTGVGDGSKQLYDALRTMGPKRLAYFEFQEEMLDTARNVLNPVFAGVGPPNGIIYYRNNTQPGGAASPAVRSRSSFDIWCAGCSAAISSDPTSKWEVNSWE